jgi:hypothetical protein
MDINVPVQKLNVIENIANVLIPEIIVLIAIAKIVIISPRLIHIRINIQKKKIRIN